MKPITEIQSAMLQKQKGGGAGAGAGTEAADDADDPRLMFPIVKFRDIHTDLDSCESVEALHKVGKRGTRGWRGWRGWRKKERKRERESVCVLVSAHKAVESG